MHIRSYLRRTIGVVLSASALVAVVGATPAAASGIPYIGGSQPGPYIGGSSYDYIPQPSPYSSFPASSSCSGYSCYGQVSDTTGQPRTNYVSGYSRDNGTYVDPYYRS